MFSVAICYADEWCLKQSNRLTVVVSKGENRDQGTSVICFELRCYNPQQLSRRGVDCTDKEA